MITISEIIRAVPAFAMITLIIHIPLLFLLHKYTRIQNFLKDVHVFFASIIIVAIGLLIRSEYQSIILSYIIGYWLIPSIGTGLIIGGLYKTFKRSFWQNFYSSFLIMTIIPFI